MQEDSNTLVVVNLVDTKPQSQNIRKFNVRRGVKELSAVKEAAGSVCSIGLGWSL